VAPQPPRLRMLQGDEAELFRTYEVALRAAVRHHILASDEVIEDACSYAWLELCWRQPDRDNVFAWLLLVATRQAWRNRERDQRERSLTEVPPDREPQRADLSREVDAHEALHALSNLPARQRDYLTLLTTGYSYHEIASLRDVSYTATLRATIPCLAGQSV
jgi:DNA-directed RNA polymerase specialized sigma24 family protein